MGNKRCRSRTKHSVLTGTILKQYKDKVTCKVQLQMPGSKQISEHKFRIEDIADYPVKEKTNRRRFQEKLLISLTKSDRIEQFTEQGYNVNFGTRRKSRDYLRKHQSICKNCFRTLCGGTQRTLGNAGRPE